MNGRKLEKEDGHDRTNEDNRPRRRTVPGEGPGRAARRGRKRVSYRACDSCAMPLRGIAEQAVLRRHPFEGRFPGGGEGRSRSARSEAVIAPVSRRLASANLPTRFGTFG